MNTKIPVKLMMSFLLMLFISNLAAQTSFGVRVGGPTQSYYIGIIDLGFIKPIFGLDYYGGAINIDSDYHYEENDYGYLNSDDVELTAKGAAVENLTTNTKQEVMLHLWRDREATVVLMHSHVMMNIRMKYVKYFGLLL